MGIGEALLIGICALLIGWALWFGQRQMEARLQAAIKAQGDVNKALIDQLSSTQAAERAQLNEIREQLDELRENLPQQYVRREDWIRMSSRIDGKLDRINTEQRALAMLLAKGARKP